MTERDGTAEREPGSVSALIRGAMDGRLSRRQIVRRAAALGVSAPMLGALLTVSPRAGAQGTPAAAAPTGDPVVIGCPYNLTGGYASVDGPARDGSMLAAEELSRAGGILGRPVELKVYDGRSETTTVTSIVKKLVEEDKVPALVGLTDTSYFLAGGPIAQEAGTVSYTHLTLPTICSV